MHPTLFRTIFSEIRAISLSAIALTSLIAADPAAADNEIGFIETFALAEDRAEVLKQLIPGSEQYYFYHALHYQNTGAKKELKNLIGEWSRRTQHSGLRDEILRREALLNYDDDPKGTLAYLRDKLGLRFNHAQEILDKKPTLPTSLDQGVIAYERLLRSALAEKRNLGRVNDFGLDYIVRNNIALTSAQRRDLVRRLKRPDYDNLVDIIVAELKTKESRGFGEFPIHFALLPGQLDDLLEKMPKLLERQQFVHTYLRKLQPSADVDMERSAVEKAAYLERAWKFVKDLAPAYNSLKANILFRQLTLELENGEYDRKKFMTYLELPRPSVGYINPEYLKDREQLRRHPVDLRADFTGITSCRPIGSDEALVREYLLHFFIEEKSIDAFSGLIRDTWLKPVFAEAKIVNNIGDQQKWYSMLSPTAYKALKERVDIDFLRTNPKQFSIDDEVSLDLHVKNVDNLIVKVYEINSLNYYLENGRQINTDLNLDGLVANEENVHTYQDPPLSRVKRSFEFPALKGKRGVWIVEFIGNSKSSRALVRKGDLKYVSRMSTAGEVFTVLDESNKILKDATIWNGGREYKATKESDGEIAIPFTNSPGQSNIILTHGGFATLANFNHKAESYRLSAAFHVDQESFLEGGDTSVAIRPSLTINGVPTTLSVLEKVKLSITSQTLDGISTTAVIEDVKIGENGEATSSFAVPARLRSIQFQLTAETENISQGKSITLADSYQFQVNQIDATTQVPAFFLSKMDDEFVLEVFGRTGEPRVNTTVQVVLHHHEFPNAIHVNLRTGDDGRIKLGRLAGIDRLQTQSSGLQSGIWSLPRDQHSHSASVHAKTGDVVSIPYTGGSTKVSVEEFALFEMRAGTFFADRLKAATIKDGLVHITGLDPGDYQLHHKQDNRIVTIRITDGDEVGRFVLGANRALEVLNAAPLQVANLETDKDTIKIQIANANPLTRVHVVANRFMHGHSLHDLLGKFAGLEPLVGSPSLHPSLYLSGRNIGDEYRYILQRKFAKIFPGNLLARPGLLLNPWELRKTETTIDNAKKGQEWKRSKEGRGSTASRAPSKKDGKRPGISSFPNFNFLASPSTVVLNVKPDKNGRITIKRAALGDRQHIHVLAVDPFNSAYRQIALADAKTAFADLRLNPGLDPKVHFTEQREVKILTKGDKLEVEDILTAEFESYETLAGIFSLYRTLNANTTFAEFDFLVRWPELKDEEKRAKYSKYASHELHFFLHRKDPEFFGKVIKPYLANKKDKTFMDHYLLENDLTDYLEPWRFSKLNLLERILLGVRLPEHKAAIARSLKELNDLRPPNPVEDMRLFATALSGKSLAAGRSAIEDEVRKVAPPRAPARPGGAPISGEDESAASEAPPVLALDSIRGITMSDAPKSSKLRLSNRSGKKFAEKQKEVEVTEELAKGLKGLKGLERAESGLMEFTHAFANKDSDKDSYAYFKADGKLREQGRSFYQKMKPTSEWAENNYYHLPIERQNVGLIGINGFWADFAAWDGKSPFVSPHTPSAISNYTEMLLALAVLDLPFKAAEHDVKINKKTLKVTAAGPILIFHKEIKQAAIAGEETPLLVSQNYYREGDRYLQVNNEQRDKFVTEEFLTGVVYGCQIVATNPTSSNQKLELLRQIPAGSIPVNRSRQTASSHLALSPYSTQTSDFHFYFPGTGDYRIFPVHLSKREDVVAFGRPFTFKVVDKLSKIDKASWDYISQWGSKEDVVNYIKQNNLKRINLDKIAWRMKEVDYFRQIIGLIQSRFAYNHTLYSYGVYHNELKPMRQFLLHSDGFLNQCGAWLDCALVSIDPVERRSYQHLEYSPLVNARAHMLGKDRKILNGRLRGQYQALMRILSYKKTLDAHDRMTIVYYLFLQDRIEEALAWFERVKRGDLATQLQYDYFDCYASFYQERPAQARTVAAKYADYPVDRWQKIFAQVTSQVDEIEGKNVKVEDDKDRDQKQDELASTEPTFDIKVEDRKVALTYQNIESATVNYYRMDLEFLFSSNPFVSSDSGRFSIIKPNRTEPLKLARGKDVHNFELPEEFLNANVLVEVVAAGQKKAQAYYSNALKVQLVENYGRLQVKHAKTGKPLSKVYVKVYARGADGQAKFFKDGYTDLRGKFDYTSLNTGGINNVQRFAILIMSKEHGALVKEAAPPKQ